MAAASDLVLPARCAACHGVGAPLCRACADAVRRSSHGVGSEAVGPRSSPSGMPCCWAGARFEGAVRLAVTAYKDEGRRDLRPVLAAALATALAAALAGDPVLRRRLRLRERVLVVPVPTSRASRRRRGDDPVLGLAVAAAAAVGGGCPATGDLAVVPALVHVRRVADQAHLDRPARAANLRGAVAVGDPWRGVLRGATCVLVDDVVTTGATLVEGARALRAGGAGHVVAATCATTPRHASTPPLWATGPPTSVRS